MSNTQQKGCDRTKLPTFNERGERNSSGSWDYYDCPECDFPVCSFCDCPECSWYDAEAWDEAVRRVARERDDVYTGSLDVTEETEGQNADEQ